MSIPKNGTLSSSADSGQARTDAGIFTYSRVDPQYRDPDAKLSGEDTEHWYLITLVSSARLWSLQVKLLLRIALIDFLLLLYLTPGCALYARLKCKDERKQITLEFANFELQKALEEVKTLRGTLPIFAKCKMYS